MMKDSTGWLVKSSCTVALPGGGGKPFVGMVFRGQDPTSDASNLVKEVEETEQKRISKKQWS